MTPKDNVLADPASRLALEACKLFRALRVTAVKFGLELASQSTARRGAKEAPDTRTALRKSWVGVVEQLGPGYRTA